MSLSRLEKCPKWDRSGIEILAHFPEIPLVVRAVSISSGISGIDLGKKEKIEKGTQQRIQERKNGNNI